MAQPTPSDPSPNITCKDCRRPFSFLVGSRRQCHFAKMKFPPPIRCVLCIQKHKLNQKDAHQNESPIPSVEKITPAALAQTEKKATEALVRSEKKAAQALARSEKKATEALIRSEKNAAQAEKKATEALAFAQRLEGAVKALWDQLGKAHAKIFQLHDQVNGTSTEEEKKEAVPGEGGRSSSDSDSSADGGKNAEREQAEFTFGGAHGSVANVSGRTTVPITKDSEDEESGHGSGEETETNPGSGGSAEELQPQHPYSEKEAEKNPGGDSGNGAKEPQPQRPCSEKEAEKNPGGGSGGGAEEPQPPHPCSRKEAEKKNRKKKKKRKKKDKQPAAAEKADHGDGSDDEDPEIAEDRLGAQLVADIRALTGGTGENRVLQTLDEAGQDRLDHLLNGLSIIISDSFEEEDPAHQEKAEKEGETPNIYAFGPATDRFETWGVYDPEAFFHLFNGTHERSSTLHFLQRSEDFSTSEAFELCEDLSHAVDDREIPPWWARYKEY